VASRAKRPPVIKKCLICHEDMDAVMSALMNTHPECNREGRYEVVDDGTGQAMLREIFDEQESSTDDGPGSQSGTVPTAAASTGRGDGPDPGDAQRPVPAQGPAATVGGEPEQVRQQDPAPASPFVPSGPSALERFIKDEVTKIIQWGGTFDPRSQQQAIGPSEIGNPCARAIAYKVWGGFQGEDKTDVWYSVLGTAFHAWMAKNVHDYYRAHDLDPPYIEHRIDAGNGLTGTTDLFTVYWGNSVVDWKLCGKDTMSAVAEEFPSKHRIQANIYGVGIMNEQIGTVDNIPDFLEGVKERKERLMGFGHRVYKNYDPRARIIKKHVDEVFEVTGRNPKLDIAVELEKRALDDEYFTSRKLYPNVDFYSGLIYEALSLPTAMFTVMFAIPRTSGWMSQWLEMVDDPEQKIARPRQIYTGGGPRDYVPIEQRS